MSSTSAEATISEPASASQTVQPADQRRRKGFQTDDRHRLGERLVERDQHAGDAGRERGEAPGERVYAVQPAAALRREQQILTRCAHADAPYAIAHEGPQTADHGRR